MKNRLSKILGSKKTLLIAVTAFLISITSLGIVAANHRSNERPKVSDTSEASEIDTNNISSTIPSGISIGSGGTQNPTESTNVAPSSKKAPNPGSPGCTTTYIPYNTTYVEDPTKTTSYTVSTGGYRGYTISCPSLAPYTSAPVDEVVTRGTKVTETSTPIVQDNSAMIEAAARQARINSCLQIVASQGGSGSASEQCYNLP